ncbi:MAG: bifunctional riboflavin kinase/FAD synthetase [Verrucomicrobia bacterium]|nr:bifunctional riboflavin kinase/FAD synthetase [Verrucomicrobiota bacterium]
MNILHSIKDLSTLKGPIVLAAGTFDGVHLGHQALIRRAMEEASACGGTAVVMTFDRHPASLLRPEKAPKLLTRNKQKIALLEGMEVSALLMLEFTRELAGVPARDFITSLAASSPLHAICVGSQWSFGKGGEGNVDLLKELGAERTFEVIQIDPVMAADSPISSTRIRKAIASGDFAEVEACLGRPFRLTGQVVRGAGLGATIGFPTANLDVDGMQLPPNGVYAVKVFRSSDLLNGVCNIGLRPTVDTSATTPTVEVHLFDCSADLVGEELSLEFVQFLRGEEKFAGLEELKTQIARDCDRARSFDF